MKVLVTGAGGFLGRRVVEALCARGHRVRALDLRHERDPASAGAVERIEADLCSSELSAACGGQDAAVHLAARMTGAPDEVVGTTVAGTRRLLDAMAAAGVRRLVLASSLSVYDWSAGSVLDEDAPLEPRPEARDGYTLAKVRQEELVRRRCAEERISLTVLRPGILWGPGREIPATVGQRLGPVHLVVGASRALPAVHVVNCADAFAAVVEGPEGTYNVIDDPELTPARLVRDALSRSGRFGIAIPAPYPLGRAVVALVHACTPSPLRPRLPGFLAPRRFAARYRPVRIDGARLRAAGWSPPRSYQACLDLTYGASA